MAELLLTPNRNGHASPPKLLGPDGKEMVADTGIPLAHYANFAAIWNQFNQTYNYAYDEAIRNSWQNTLSMRRDCFIWGCLDERYRAVTQSPWHVDYPDEEDEGQQAVAGELEKLILAIPRLGLMLRNLEDAVWYGRYGVQVATGPCDANGVPQTGIKYHVPVNGDKIQVGWDGIPRVMISSTVSTKYTEKGWNVITGQQSPMVVLDKPDLRERFLINQFERDDADYFEGEMAGMVGGVGVRSRIYWAWWMRQEMLSWAVNYMRKVGTLGLLVFPFAEGNPDSEAAAQENIKQAGNRSSLMVPVPAGSDPKQVAPFVISPSNAGIDSLTSMIDAYWERHIERYIVGQNMSDGKDNDSGLGGSGRAEFAANSKYDKIKGDCDTLAETLTMDLLKPLHRWNYAGQQFVYSFKFGVKDPKSAEKLESGIKLASLVEIKADELRDAGGFSKPQPGDEIAGSASFEEPTGFDAEGKPIGKSSQTGPSGGIKEEEADNFARYAYVESEHPRADDGKWTDAASRAVKEMVGTQQMSQPRSKAGGEEGPNGEWYPGGAFIATQDLPKRLKDKLEKRTKGAVEIEPGNRTFPKPGEMAIYDKMQSGYLFNHRTMDYDRDTQVWKQLSEAEKATYEEILAKYKSGERTIKVNDYPTLAGLRDVALLYVANQPIPGAVLSQLPEEYRERLSKWKPRATQQNLQRDHDAMNDAQFATAMAELRTMRESLIEQRQQNYARSNEDAVDLIRREMQRYQAPANSPVTLQMQPAQIEGLSELVQAIREQRSPVIEVQPSTATVNVAASEVKVENVVNVPEQPPATVNVAAAEVIIPKQERPIVNINVPEPSEYEETAEVVRDSNGLISKIRKFFKKRK